MNPQELVSLHIGRRRRLDDEPQDRPLGAGTLDGVGSQPSGREKGPVSGAGRKCHLPTAVLRPLFPLQQNYKIVTKGGKDIVFYTKC